MMASLPLAIAFMVAMIIAFPLWFVGAFYVACIVAVVMLAVADEIQYPAPAGAVG